MICPWVPVAVSTLSVLCWMNVAAPNAVMNSAIEPTMGQTLLCGTKYRGVPFVL